MGFGEFLIATHQFVDILLNIRLSEHAFPNEVGQVTHRFHGYGLVEQFQCLRLFDTEVLAKAIAVIGKTIEHIYAFGFPQTLFQVVDVAAKIGEVLLNGQVFVGQHVVFSDLIILHPQDLGQTDSLPSLFIPEHSQQHGVVIITLP